jgi:molybdate transport system substrate-binding protein
MHLAGHRSPGGTRRQDDLRMRARFAPATISLVALFSAACGLGGGGGAGPPSRAAPELIVFAASSLTESFGEMEAVFEADHAGTDVKLSLESSSILASQIVEGAPADVFASADQVQMRVVQAEGLARDPVPFATNALVVVRPEGNPAGIEKPADVANEGVKLVLAGREVPAGNYARAMLSRLGLRDEAEENVVSNEEDVKAVVNKVRLGEADAGVVYRTDVTDEIERDVDLIEVPSGLSPLAVYPVAAIEGSPHRREANEWVRLLTSRRGRSILEKHGFGIPL